MSSRFKFRVWNGTKFVKSARYIKAATGELFSYEADYGGTFSSHESLGKSKGIIQQFTGLQDKNSKEIYEGDIIMNEADHDNAAMCVVGWSVYEEIGWALFYPFREPMEPLKQSFNGIDLYEEYPMTYNRGNCYEIIGNIFENIELLK